MEETKKDLTNHRAGDSSPDWSPDGTKIAFVSNRDGARSRSQIYVMDTHGKNPIRLTDGPGFRRGIQTGLPMGERLRSPSTVSGRLSRRDGRRWWIIVRNLKTRLGDPSWSPDGRARLHFYREEVEAIEIYVIGVDGLGRKRVTHHLED